MDTATTDTADVLNAPARTVVTVNLLIAVGVIAMMSIATLVASILGRPIPMAVGVLAHEGGTLLVVLNSLVLLTARGPAISNPARPLRAAGTN